MRPLQRISGALHLDIFDSLKKMSQIVESFDLFATTSGLISRASESQALGGSFLLP